MKHTENDFDDFEKQVLLPHRMSNLGPGLATGDINNDGQEDFYLGGASGQSGQLYTQQTDGTFAKMDQPAFSEDAISEDLGASFLMLMAMVTWICTS